MNRLRDIKKNKKLEEESGKEKVSSVFYSPRASSGFYLLCVCWHQEEEWMIQRERLIFPITSGMQCDGMQVADTWMYFIV